MATRLAVEDSSELETVISKTARIIRRLALLKNRRMLIVYYSSDYLELLHTPSEFQFVSCHEPSRLWRENGPGKPFVFTL